MKIGYLVVCASLLFLSCSSEKKNDDDKISSKLVVSGSEEWKQRRVEEQDRIWELGKKMYPSSTYDLLPVTEDTLIAATQYNGLVLTIDAGKTWKEVKSPGRINELTFNNKRQLWGLKSWKGIHEADFCFLYLSNDLGKSWTKFELDTKNVFPKTFYSQPSQPLRIVDYAGKVFQLKDVNPTLSWTLIDSVSEGKENSSTPPSRTTVVTDSQGRKWAYNRQGIFLIGNDTTKVY